MTKEEGMEVLEFNRDFLDRKTQELRALLRVMRIDCADEMSIDEILEQATATTVDRLRAFDRNNPNRVTNYDVMLIRSAAGAIPPLTEALQNLPGLQRNFRTLPEQQFEHDCQSIWQGIYGGICLAADLHIKITWFNLTAI